MFLAQRVRKDLNPKAGPRGIPEHRGKGRIWKACREGNTGHTQRTQTWNNVRILSSNIGSQKRREQCFQILEEKSFPFCTQPSHQQEWGQNKGILDYLVPRSVCLACIVLNSLQETPRGWFDTNEEVTKKERQDPESREFTWDVVTGSPRMTAEPPEWGAQVPAVERGLPRDSSRCKVEPRIQLVCLAPSERNFQFFY